MKELVLVLAIVAMTATLFVLRRDTAQTNYVPQAQFCANASSNLCPILPAYIGSDPTLNRNIGYPGLFTGYPTNPNNDVQTPFDNMAWQMFIALNWAQSALNKPPSVGLTIPGQRVFQTYRKVSSLFGNSPVRAGCTAALALPVFNLGSNGKGKPMPNNEEYFQASTNLPLIDINGNWVIFERRVNDIEAAYLLAPNNDPSQTLTTMAGQAAFTKAHPKGPHFTASATTQTGANGSIEIKTAWRILNRAAGDDPSRYYTQDAILAVPRDLVNGGTQKICSTVTLGLVGMHIIQRNPVDSKNPALLPQWIWATFEHVDNAPMAQAACDVVNGCPNGNASLNQPSCGAAAPSPSVRYSFYNPRASVPGTNVAPSPSSSPALPNYPWNSRQPFAKGGTTAATAVPQVTRCWAIYPTTAQLNSQWQSALAAINSKFQYYMLVGTQWGANVEPRSHNLPQNAVPAMLSNLTLETYIQNYTGSNPSLPGPGSCVGCHSFATLAQQPSPAPSPPPSDFSFLPFLAQPETARSKLKTAR